MTSPIFERVALLGIGLIGSSISHAIRRGNIARHIAIYTRSKETLDRSRELCLGDSYHTSPESAVTSADLVIFCVPLGANTPLIRECSSALAEGAIITDVGSCKRSVINDIAPHLPDKVAFVPAHPVAGTERSGPDAGFAELFDGHWCILTPEEGTDPKAVDKVADFWEQIGSDVEIMDADHHDQVLAITSHLPHLIAYTIVETATDLEIDLKKEVIKFSAGGFRDFTRIAASDPTMWRDVFLNNRDAVLEILGRFSEDLTSLQRAIRKGDGDQLHKSFTRTRALHRGVLAAKQQN